MISIDYMHSENIWFSWSKSSNYPGKFRCHACDEPRTDRRKWKIGQCSGRPETATTFNKNCTFGSSRLPLFVSPQQYSVTPVQSLKHILSFLAPKQSPLKLPAAANSELCISLHTVLKERRIHKKPRTSWRLRKSQRVSLWIIWWRGWRG